MHSRIYVLEGSYEQDDTDIYEMLHAYIACDYVMEVYDDSDGFKSDLDWLGKTYPVENGILKNTKENREKYLREKYDRVREEIEKGFENFANDTGEYRLRMTINDRYGFYVVINDMLMTLDDFIFGHDHEGEYKITQIFDYHV